MKSIISHTHEYQSAGEIAERARVSPPTARKQLESLHRSGYVVVRDGRSTGYKRNPDQRRFERIQQFADRDKLLVVKRVFSDWLDGLLINAEYIPRWARATEIRLSLSVGIEADECRFSEFGR